MDEHPDVIVNRTLILIGKVLQNIANLVEFSGDKEPYMTGMNAFLISSLPDMKKFLDDVSTVPLQQLPRKQIDIYEAKELASLYRLLKRVHPTLKQNATNPEELRTLAQLSDILKELQAIEQIQI